MAPLSNRDKLEDPILPKSRISQEIESLRRRIADLEGLERELAQAELALSQASSSRVPATADEIRSKIKERLGFLPLFLAPVADLPEVLHSLWQQSLDGYYDNPLPELLKEKLFARLARYCASSYAIVTRSCNLYNLGMSAKDVLRLLERPTPSPEDDMNALVGSLTRAPHSGQGRAGPHLRFRRREPEGAGRLQPHLSAGIPGNRGAGGLAAPAVPVRGGALHDASAHQRPLFHHRPQIAVLHLPRAHGRVRQRTEIRWPGPEGAPPPLEGLRRLRIDGPPLECHRRREHCAAHHRADFRAARACCKAKAIAAASSAPTTAGPTT